MCEQTSLFFSFVYDDVVLFHIDPLKKQMSCLSLFSMKTLLCLNMQNFGLYYLIENKYEFVYDLRLYSILIDDELSHWGKSRLENTLEIRWKMISY